MSYVPKTDWCSSASQLWTFRRNTPFSCLASLKSSSKVTFPKISYVILAKRVSQSDVRLVHARIRAHLKSPSLPQPFSLTVERIPPA